MGWLDIIERFKGAPAQGPADQEITSHEKRKAWRISRQVAMVGFRADGSKFEVLGTNFSPGGMRIETAARLKKDEEIRLRVTRPRVNQPRSLEDEDDQVLVSVRWCRGHRSLPNFESGVMFVGSDAQTRRKIARFLLEDCRLGMYDPRERRKVPRTPVEGMKAVFSTEDGTVSDARVLDLAVGGVLLESLRSLEVREPLALKIFLAPDLPTLDCRGTVVRATRVVQSRTFEIGVMFTDVPRDHNQRLVGVLANLLRGESH